MAWNQPPGLSWRPSVCSNIAMGIPTFLDRPATTTFFPSVGIPRINILMLVELDVNLLKRGGKQGLFLPVRLMISQTPQGVAGSIVDWSRHMRPTLTTWKPSTSLVGATALQMVRSSMWSAGTQQYSLWTRMRHTSLSASVFLPGKGSCTRRPSTRWSVLSLSIRSNNSSSLMSECLRIVSLLIPVGGWESVKTIYTGCLNTCFACTWWEQTHFPSYQHQRQLASYSRRKSDWQDCPLPGSHSGGVSCDRLRPTSPRRPWPPLGSAVLVSFLRWQQPPVWQTAAAPTLKLNVSPDSSSLETATVLPVPNSQSPGHHVWLLLNRTYDTRHLLYPRSNYTWARAHPSV